LALYTVRFEHRRSRVQEQTYCVAQIYELTALTHGGIARLHAAARETTIARNNSPDRPNEAVTGSPQPSRKK